MQRAKEFPFELGWVHSLQTGSGNGCNLVAAAVDRSVYATTKSNQMKHMLRDYGFIVLSQPFPSTRDANTNLSLFIRSSPRREEAEISFPFKSNRQDSDVT
jgi:hypothetical protein